MDVLKKTSAKKMQLTPEMAKKIRLKVMGK